jgi:hypothetical protein
MFLRMRPYPSKLPDELRDVPERARRTASVVVPSAEGAATMPEGDARAWYRAVVDLLEKSEHLAKTVRGNRPSA